MLACSNPAACGSQRTRHSDMSYLISDRYIGRSFDRYGEFSEGEIELFRQIV